MVFPIHKDRSGLMGAAKLVSVRMPSLDTIDVMTGGAVCALCLMWKTYVDKIPIGVCNINGTYIYMLL
jgi:hypothetical protein